MQLVPLARAPAVLFAPLAAGERPRRRQLWGGSPSSGAPNTCGGGTGPGCEPAHAAAAGHEETGEEGDEKTGSEGGEEAGKEDEQDEGETGKEGGEETSSSEESRSGGRDETRQACEEETGVISCSLNIGLPVSWRCGRATRMTVGSRFWFAVVPLLV